MPGHFRYAVNSFIQQMFIENGPRIQGPYSRLEETAIVVA